MDGFPRQAQKAPSSNGLGSSLSARALKKKNGFKVAKLHALGDSAKSILASL
jgi:hypothetical protein